MDKELSMKPWLLGILACPIERELLKQEEGSLICAQGHRWPVVGGIPVLLREDIEATHPVFAESLSLARNPHEVASEFARVTNGDLLRFVQDHIAGTHGMLYRRLRGPLHRYPIPRASLREVCGQACIGGLFLDVGSHWGRWALAAASLGFVAVAMDPSLKAAIVGAHIANRLCLNVGYVVGDARCLPFRSATADVVFSYSTLQHLDKTVVRKVLDEARRVLRPGGRVLVQMPNRAGIRQLFNALWQRIRRDTNPFRVRYWSIRELREVFTEIIGPTSIRVDGFFSLNPRLEDLDLLQPHYGAIVLASESLKRLSRLPGFRWIGLVADSLWVESRLGVPRSEGGS
jgi:SAM-dependent methyltransferase